MTDKNQPQSSGQRRFRIKYAVIFFILGLLLVGIGLMIGNLGWLLLWPGISFIILATGYGWFGAKVFGKRQDGTVAWWARALLLPYLCLTWLAWSIQRHKRSTQLYDEILPGLWLGRRVYDHELPKNIGLVVDLTIEFRAPRGMAENRAYLSIPTLDELPPGEDAFIAGLRTIIDWDGDWDVYIHCVSGEGRSAMLVAALLLAKGVVGTPGDAIARVKAKRPNIRLSHAQQRFIEELGPSLRKRSAEFLNDDQTYGVME